MVKRVSLLIVVFSLVVGISIPTAQAANTVAVSNPKVQAVTPTPCTFKISHPTQTKVDGDLSVECGFDLKTNHVVFTITGTKLAQPIVYPFDGNHGGYNFSVAEYGDGQLCISGTAPTLNPNPQGECFTFGNPVVPPTVVQNVLPAAATPAPGQGAPTAIPLGTQAVQTYGPNDCPIGTVFEPVASGTSMQVVTQDQELNLREEAGTQFKKVREAMTPKTLIVSSGESKCAYGDIWMKVTAEGMTGWAAYQGRYGYFFMVPVDVKTATPQFTPTIEVGLSPTPNGTPYFAALATAQAEAKATLRALPTATPSATATLSLEMVATNVEGTFIAQTADAKDPLRTEHKVQTAVAQGVEQTLQALANPSATPTKTPTPTMTTTAMPDIFDFLGTLDPPKEGMWVKVIDGTVIFNVYTDPTRTGVIGTTYFGRHFPLISESNGFYEVMTEKGVGYITSNPNITTVGGLPKAAPTPTRTPTAGG